MVGDNAGRVSISDVQINGLQSPGFLPSVCRVARAQQKLFFPDHLARIETSSLMQNDFRTIRNVSIRGNALHMSFILLIPPFETGAANSVKNSIASSC